MSTLPNELIEKIRQEADIVEVIGDYVQLKRQGRNHFGLCPFHDEKSPSFSVTEEKQIFHCFGCGKGGNVYTFLMEKEGFSFIDAVTYLADRANIELPKIKQHETAYSEDAQVVLSASEWLTKYYHHVLKYTEEGKLALQYLHDRGLTETIIDQLQLGFAPNESDVTVEFLLKKDFHQQQLIKVGVLSQATAGNAMDPFRGRVIFPIQNHLGRTVAFGGRAIGEMKPKYLNSPENEIFHKGSLLYHFHLAKQFIRKKNQVIIFEGYMDVISAHQADIKNVVATLGTTLSEQQAKLLRRYADEVVLCYDTDEAGLKGMYQAAQLLKKMNVQVKIASIPNNQDPDDFIQAKGADAFEKQVIQQADTYFTFFMKYKSRGIPLHVVSEKVALIEALTKELATVDSPIEREIYANDMATMFDVSVETIIQDLNKYKKPIQTNNLKDNRQQSSNTINEYDSYTKPTKQLKAYERAERLLLAHMLQSVHVLEHVQALLGVQFNVEIHQVIVTLLYGHYEKHNEIIISDFIDDLSHPEEKQLVIELSMLALNETTVDEEIEDYIHVIKHEGTDQQQIRLLKEELKMVERENDPIRAAEIGMKIIQLEKQLKLRTM